MGIVEEASKIVINLNTEKANRNLMWSMDQVWVDYKRATGKELSLIHFTPNGLHIQTNDHKNRNTNSKNKRANGTRKAISRDKPQRKTNIPNNE